MDRCSILNERGHTLRLNVMSEIRLCESKKLLWEAGRSSGVSADSWPFVERYIKSAFANKYSIAGVRGSKYSWDSSLFFVRSVLSMFSSFSLSLSLSISCPLIVSKLNYGRREDAHISSYRKYIAIGHRGGFFVLSWSARSDITRHPFHSYQRLSRWYTFMNCRFDERSYKHVKFKRSLIKYDFNSIYPFQHM